MTQTAVEWLIQQVSEKEPNGFYFIDILEDVERIFEQAKQMEKEQIMESWKHGNLPTFLGRVLTAEQYYNETYGQQQ